MREKVDLILKNSQSIVKPDFYCLLPRFLPNQKPLELCKKVPNMGH